jgi:hypothetical protein
MEYYYGVLVIGEQLEQVKEFIGIFCSLPTKPRVESSSNNNSIEAHYFQEAARVTFWGLQTRDLSRFVESKNCELVSYFLKIVYLNDHNKMVMGNNEDFNLFRDFAARSYSNSIKVPALRKYPLLIVHHTGRINSRKSPENSLNLDDFSVVEQLSISGTFKDHLEEIKEVNRFS